MTHQVTFRTPSYYTNERMANACQEFYHRLGTSLMATLPETKEMVLAIGTFPFAVEGWTCSIDQKHIDWMSVMTGSSYAMIINGPGM